MHGNRRRNLFYDYFLLTLGVIIVKATVSPVNISRDLRRIQHSRSYDSNHTLDISWNVSLTHYQDGCPRHPWSRGFIGGRRSQPWAVIQGSFTSSTATQSSTNLQLPRPEPLTEVPVEKELGTLDLSLTGRAQVHSVSRAWWRRGMGQLPKWLAPPQSRWSSHTPSVFFGVLRAPARSWHLHLLWKAFSLNILSAIFSRPLKNLRTIVY